MSAHTVYALADPRTQRIRYVGVTENLAQRLVGHRQERTLPAKYLWLRRIKFRPVVIELETGLPDDLRVIRERYWIAWGARHGWPLLNSYGVPEVRRPSTRESKRLRRLAKSVQGYRAKVTRRNRLGARKCVACSLDAGREVRHGRKRACADVLATRSSS